jgi:hypothetical protein
MSYSLTLRCDGTRNRQPCRVERVRGFAFGPSISRDDTALQALDGVAELARGWRTSRDGGDLCPSLEHDQDQP